MVRSGDEPLHARSPLRLRLGLALAGVVLAGAFAARAWTAGRVMGVLAGGAVVLIALVNAIVVLRRMRSGPHYQPGRDVPPYQPVAAPRPHAVSSSEVPEQVRQRRYLVLMGICLGLISVAWVWVRLFSVTAAVVLSMVAMVIPPIAAVVANAGWSGRRR